MPKVKIISHRGNLSEPTYKENQPEYINKTLASFDCEIDLWMDSSGQMWLGHDREEYPIPYEWIADRHHKLWIHCKNIRALEFCHNTGWNYFWHEKDRYTLTSKGYIWCYPSAPASPWGIIAVPEQTYSDELILELLEKGKALGVCTDRPFYYVSALKEVEII